MERMVWFIISLTVLIAIILVLYFFGWLFKVLFFLIAAIAVVVLARIMLRKFEPYEAALIYRFGKFNRASSGGWTLVIPGVERIGAVVDMREQQEHIDIPTITKEGLQVNLYALAFFFVNNAQKVILNVKDFRSAMHNLIESRIRDIAGEFTFTQLIINVETIMETLQKGINEAMERWGLTLNTLELQRVEPPKQVMEAIKKVRIAREDLEAKRFAAEARRIIIKALGEGTKNYSDRAITYLYIKALENMKASKMMFPAEFLDVVRGEGGTAGKELAKGLIAGETFEKALDMVGQEIQKSATLKTSEVTKKLGVISKKSLEK